MTIPPTLLEEILVVGQRRKNGTADPFPPEPSYDPPLPGQEPEVGEDEGLHPCDDPQRREDWNVDAAARRARDRFLQEANAAGEAGLTFRERGAWLIRNPDGSIRVGPTILGSIFQPDVKPSTSFPFDGIYPEDIVGYVHVHDVGFHAPSYDPDGGDDLSAFMEIVGILNNNGGDGDTLRGYIIAQTSDNNPYNKINIYTKEIISIAAETQSPGPEVNPDAQSCAAE